MEVKKSKVTKYDALPKRGDYQSYGITFEDGTDGITFAKYTLGEEGEYYVEVKQGANGKSYNRIMKPKQERSSRGGSRYYWNADYDGKAIAMGMAYSKDLFKDKVAGRLGLTNIHAIIIPAMQEKLAQMTMERHKEFVLFAMSYATQMVLDEDLRTKMLESFNIKEVSATSLLEMVTRLFDGMIKAMVKYDNQ